jgi:hypothetical protein
MAERGGKNLCSSDGRMRKQAMERGTLRVTKEGRKRKIIDP